MKGAKKKAAKKSKRDGEKKRESAIWETQNAELTRMAIGSSL
jgi:hypothetical protein